MAAALYYAYKKRRATRGAASGLCLKKFADGLWQHRSRLPAFEPPTRMSGQLLPNRSRGMRHSGAIQRKPIPRLHGHISEYSTLEVSRSLTETRRQCYVHSGHTGSAAALGSCLSLIMVTAQAFGGSFRPSPDRTALDRPCLAR